MSATHISDHDLERYCLGIIREEEQRAPLEEHLLWCLSCLERAEESRDYVETVRLALRP